MDYSYRRHIDAALQNLVLSESDEVSEKLAAGFTDLVAFSKLVDELPETELSNLIDRFEGVVMDVCVETGVRLVKIVGDSALFVSPEPVRAASGSRDTRACQSRRDLAQSTGRLGLRRGRAARGGLLRPSGQRCIAHHRRGQIGDARRVRGIRCDSARRRGGTFAYEGPALEERWARVAISVEALDSD